MNVLNMVPAIALSLVSATVLATILFLAFRLHSTSQSRYLRSLECGFGLKMKHRSLLKKLAHAAELPDVAPLLMVPSLFDWAVDRLDPDVDELLVIEALRNKDLGAPSRLISSKGKVSSRRVPSTRASSE